MFGTSTRNEKQWPTEKMKEVAPAIQSDNLPKSEGNWLLNLDAIQSNSGQILFKNRVSEAELNGSIMTFSSDHILYSKLRPYLNKVVVPDESGFGTTELIPLLPNKAKLTRTYLAYLLRSDAFVSKFSSAVAGTKMPRVSMDVFWKFDVPLPPMNLQKEFGSFVNQIDKSKVIFSTTLKSRFIEMFGHQDQNEKEFRISTIGESCIIRDSERIPITSTYRESGPYPYYGANGLQDYVKDYIFDGEFVLVAEDGGYFDDPDRPIAYSVSGKCWVNNHAHILQPGKEINVQYLEWALKYRDVTNVINGTTRSKLTQAAMRSITILLPPKELQDSFSQFLIQVDKSKFKLKNTVKSLTIKIKQISSEDKAHSAHIFNIVY